ncbi:phage tail assembly chaperone [Pectobacterium wasabiae]|uniref:Phage tail protein n=1 Tax=Pectobacterium wasabiae TaxID=55208 RepID=A0AAW3ELT1_9GAMM|nr:phage tail assembly chaperone [Pectobacterium wasabiae]AOR64864.1 phage tail protein [Pectobacterium wasabiae CFBP 3304]EJS96287.1 Phage tail assembly chaperone family protein [Pectobacterium wasabiae CFBP 3304]KFX09869.1 phage tail protein [Pectobacterium wasabiae]KGA30071.1 phage tail protein [Pectobacterium wasabiae]
MAKKSIKSLALAPGAGFLTKAIEVPEWEGVKVILREPSAEAWLRWQDAVKTDDDGESLSVSERARRNLHADATLFIDILRDEDGEPVFSVDDIEEVETIYGPVHSRLLRQALDIINDTEIAKKK